MNLEHSFTVPVGIDEAWKILLDIERIGPCMPGATIESVDGDDFTGSVKVKLGPIGLTYKGKASFVEKDEAAHRAVIDARGRDARGNGTASAKVTAALTDGGGSTTVNVTTDLDITGKPAQFGRGVMVDVGNKLIGQFADNLAATITGDDAASGASQSAAPAAAAASTAPAKAAAKKAEPKAAAKKTTATKATAKKTGSNAAATKSQPSSSEPGSAPANTAGSPPSLSSTSAASAPPTHRATPPSRPSNTEPIDLGAVAGPAVAKRLAPVGLALLVVVLFVIRRRRG